MSECRTIPIDPDGRYVFIAKGISAEEAIAAHSVRLSCSYEQCFKTEN